MTRNFLTLFALLLVGLLLTPSLQAQMGVGVRGGINVARYNYNDTDDEPDQKRLVGYNFGVLLEIPITTVFSLQPEINFQRRGTAYNVGQAYFEQRLNYIEVPLLAKLGYTTEKFTVAAMLGPSFAYVLSGSNYGEGGDIGGGIRLPAVDQEINFDEERLERIDFNAILGGQLGFPVGPGKLVLDGRYQFGFIDLREEATGNEEFKLTNRGINLTLGYILTLGDY